MQSIINALRKRYSPDPLKERAAMLNVTVRNTMAQEIEEEIKNASETSQSSEAAAVELENILNESNEALIQCYAKLKSLEETENFVGSRLRSYRQRLTDYNEESRHEILEEQANETQEVKTGDVSVTIEVEDGCATQFSKEKSDAVDEQKRNAASEILQNLEKVEQTHERIEHNILQMKKQILSLEKKIEETKEKQRECNDFLKVVRDLQLQPEGAQQQGGDTDLQHYSANSPEGDPITFCCSTKPTCAASDTTCETMV